MKIKKVHILFVICLMLQTSSQSEDKIIDLYLGIDHLQKHIYQFNDHVIKASIVKDKNESKVKESICEIKKQKMKLKTTFSGSLTQEYHINSLNNSKSYFFVHKHQDHIVAIKKIGDISIFQIKDNILQLISQTQSYTLSQQSSQVLIDVFFQEDFLYLVSENKEGYLLKTFLLSNVYIVKSVYDDPIQIFENKLYGKILCTQMQGDYMYMLSKYFLLFVINIDPNYKHPKIYRKIYISNMFQPQSFDLDQERIYMIDEEKGIFQFELTLIHQVSNKSEFYLKGESIYNKQKSGKLILKPFASEDYFLVIGKQNQRNYIAEVHNDNTISTSDDEPLIKKVYVNEQYIFFITEDNVHIIYRGIDESQVKSIEKQQTFEIIGVQDIYIDKASNTFYAITNEQLLVLNILTTQPTLVCYYNQRSEVTEDQTNHYLIQYISNQCTDNTVRYCSYEIQANIYIGKSPTNSESQAFFIGFLVGLSLVFIVITTYLIKKKKNNNKIQKYNHFDNENEQEAQSVDSRKV